MFMDLVQKYTRDNTIEGTTQIDNFREVMMSRHLVGNISNFHLPEIRSTLDKNKSNTHFVVAQHKKNIDKELNNIFRVDYLARRLKVLICCRFDTKIGYFWSRTLIDKSAHQMINYLINFFHSYSTHS